MSSLRREWYSLEEYFALERASERRFEYRNGEIVCMSGGSRQHAAIASNMIGVLNSKLRGGNCRVYGSDLAVYVPDGPPYRYPDVSVVCGEARFRQVDGRDCLENAVFVGEVLSPTSADYDRGAKFEEYKSIPEFMEYLLIAQDRPHVAHRVRLGARTWNETVYDSLDSVLHLKALGIDLALSETYEDVSFS
jgi:Uma2 family endonuclease